MIQEYLESHHRDSLNSSDGWVMLSPSGRISDATNSVAKFLRLRKENILGATVDKFVPPLEETEDRKLVRPLITEWMKEAFESKEARHYYEAMQVTIFNYENLSRHAARIWWTFIEVQKRSYCVVFLDWENNQVSLGMKDLSKAVILAPQRLDKISDWINAAGKSILKFINSWKVLISAILTVGAVLTVYKDFPLGHEQKKTPPIRETTAPNGDRVIDICQRPDGKCSDDGGMVPLRPDP